METAGGDTLSDEHIFPEGLGGKVYLPMASCEACRKVTSAFERSCLRTMFGATRAFLQVYGKRRKATRPTTLPVIRPEDRTVEQVPISEYPFIFMQLEMDPARILLGVPHPKKLPSDCLLVTDFRIRSVTTQSAIRNITGYYDQTHLLRVDLPISHFLQMLAKIAHTSATALLGHGKFTPVLNDFIRTPGGDVNVGTHYVGGAQAFGKPVEQIGSGRNAHEATLQLPLLRERGWVVMRVQLFSPFGSVYDVFVGTL